MANSGRGRGSHPSRRGYFAIGGVVVGIACVFAVLALTGDQDPGRVPLAHNNANDPAQVAARERGWRGTRTASGGDG